MKILLCLISAVSLLAQQPQNTVKAPVVSVILRVAPVGDCRSQYYNIAIDNNNQQWICSVGTGAWTQISSGVSANLNVSGILNFTGQGDNITGLVTGINSNTEIRMIDPLPGGTSLFGCNLSDPTLRCYASDTPTDANNRFTINGNGKFSWGSGASPTDTTLFRSGVNSLETDGHLSIVAPLLGSALVLTNTGTSGRTYSLYSSDNSAGVLGTGNFAIYDDGAGVARMVIDPSGKMAIGTTTPTISGTGKFQVTGNTVRPIDALRTPASSSEACNIGEISADASFLYFCKSSNTWVRSAWSTF